jgi:hypothetical protein
MVPIWVHGPRQALADMVCPFLPKRMSRDVRNHFNAGLLGVVIAGVTRVAVVFAFCCSGSACAVPTIRWQATS